MNAKKPLERTLPLAVRRVLIIEDDGALAGAMRRRLQDHGFAVTIATDAEGAVEILDNSSFDVIVLDLVLPGMSGIDFLTQLRSRKLETPVIVTSGRTELDTRVQSLEIGADDYLVKPYEYRELIARVNAIIRRAELKRSVILEADDLSFDCVRREAFRGGEKIDLKPKEADLLELFLRNPNRLLSRAEVLKSVWGITFDPGTNIVDVYVSYLRSSIDKYSKRPLIYTLRGRGFMLIDPPPES